jgi:putative ABC transport system permease protein
MIPSSMTKTGSRALVVKTAGPPLAMMDSVKREIWAVDRSVSVGSSKPLTEYLKEFSYGEPRLGLYVFGAFAGLGLALVTLGVYSMIAYNVSRQTQEIGIRMALGGSRGRMLALVMGQGMKLVGIGVVLGLGLAYGATRLLASLLFGVKASDPLTFAAVAAILSAAALVAAYVPARRATAVDPVVALRYE